MQVAYAVTPDQEPVIRVDLTPEKVAAAMRAFFRIAAAWGLSNEQAQVLLGRPARSTFYSGSAVRRWPCRTTRSAA